MNLWSQTLMEAVIVYKVIKLQYHTWKLALQNLSPLENVPGQFAKLQFLTLQMNF